MNKRPNLKQLKEFKPNGNLQKYIDAFCFFRNKTGSPIDFPVRAILLRDEIARIHNFGNA